MRRFCVLIVDDSSVLRNALAEWFATIPEASGVAVAASGHEALELAIDSRPDLVVTDVRMPGMDGFELTRRIRASPKAPRVVVTSLHDSPNFVELAQRAGADRFIQKEKLFAELAGYLYATFGGEAMWEPAPVAESARG